MATALFPHRYRSVSYCAVIAVAGLMGRDILRADETIPTPAVTNLVQLMAVSSQNPKASHRIQVEGDVWWASAAEGKLVLHDASAAAELELNPAGPMVRAGQRVRLEGEGTVARSGASLKLGATGPVVDNNGVHSMIEKSGAVYLTAGLHPIRVEWFNGVEKSGLEVDYEGPGLPKQRIPDAELFRAETTSANATNFLNGVDYERFDAPGEVVPDFETLHPTTSGTAHNFDAGLANGTEHVVLRFTGLVHVPRDGLYTFYTKSDDGSRLFINAPSFRLHVIGQTDFPPPLETAPGQKLSPAENCQWARVEGRVSFITQRAAGVELELISGTGRMRVRVADNSGLSAGALMGARVRATGVCQSVRTFDGQFIAGVLLVPAGSEIEVLAEKRAFASAEGGALPVLTTAAGVHRLKREEAERGYPVRLRGVVTCVLPEHQAFTIEDSTRGIYVVDFSESRPAPPEVGEFLEIEGSTDPSLFAPIVNARQVAGLGAGRLPNPVRPTWDQLMNGSLDAQYVEIEGIITAIQTNSIAMLTRGGVIRIELRAGGTKADDLKRYEDALVRVRGCLFASWDYLTHQVKMGEVRIYNASIMVDQPAPADLFSIPAKTVADLLLFDPQGGVFQRVKVSGQIVGARESEYFLMQDANGLRFIAKKPIDLQAGDLVEVVGFPDLLSSPAPLLREAVARKIGRAPLPKPENLAAEDMIRPANDSVRVRLEGRLVSVRQSGVGQALELQNGVRTFIARLNSTDPDLSSLPAGSRLAVVGVYAGRGGNRAAGRDIASFEVLLNSPADVTVLARPPWWTLERLLVIVGALACVLAATTLWITQLHRKVEERTAQLGEQIRERQRVEHLREMEQERARIAQDLHDELGSGITEISMLAARAKSASAPDEKRNSYLEQAGDKAREMVTALDEIVWAMNPRHNSLASLVSYFSLYADRFLSLANIAWKLDAPTAPLDHVVDSRRRHQLFLAFKEGLTNVVRHSGATEVRLGIQAEQGELRLSIADNGRGMPSEARTEEMDGLANMRARLERLGGRFEIHGENGRGTVVRLYAPLT